MKKLDLDLKLDQIKELNLNEYTLPIENYVTLPEGEGWKLLRAPSSNFTKKAFVDNNRYVGKYEFSYVSGYLFFRIRRLPERSYVIFQEEPYIYPECWDATPLDSIKGALIISETLAKSSEGVLRHGGRSSIKEVENWYNTVAPKIRNFVFYFLDKYDYYNLKIRPATDEEKRIFDEHQKNASSTTEDTVAESNNETISGNNTEIAEPTKSDFLLAIKDSKVRNLTDLEELQELWQRSHFECTKLQIETLAKDFLNEYIEEVDPEDNYEIKVVIFELEKVATIKQKTEVVTTTDWFLKTTDKPKPNGTADGLCPSECKQSLQADEKPKEYKKTVDIERKIPVTF